MAVNVTETVEKARSAQKKFEMYTQEQVDEVVQCIGRVVYENAEILGPMAAKETGMGVAADKIVKCRSKSGMIWNYLRDKKSVGIIKRNPARGLVYLAKPVGVVGAIQPCTNPVVTLMMNSMAVLKGRNSIIISPHPKSVKCSMKTVELIKEELDKIAVPKDLIQIIPEADIQISKELMASVDLIAATGGTDMVKAAYSSGKPSLGVGAGNTQVIIDRDADIADAVSKVIAGRRFDNGIICSGEQCVFIPDDMYDNIINEFKRNGVFVIHDPNQIEIMRHTIFPENKMNKKLIGKDPQKIAEAAGITIPADTTVFFVELEKYGIEESLCDEKLCPVLVGLKYHTFDEAIQMAKENYFFKGAGHTASIHSYNKVHIEMAGCELPVSRIMVNQSCAITAGGSYANGLNPTTTLGCGTWGGNSVSENITYKHFLNISRISYCIADAHVPAAEELWNK
ncbi:aldehyde dehydrogenase family protein [Megasphaera paucivorans]|uniref:Succinate-semialdehyde dehydrogenase n=1 Tax=Megasphaera paucivorans TaxID=349095 RepID=A0A1G9ZQE1_9FIRM|nr:aldehyde dehydrogenase family protein [Megasphaera paucivorans]SDN23518.1 succinate-semialdehyde dehydrogenase [Megasphaera paucivorans]